MREESVGWSLLALVVSTSWARSGIYGGWHPPLWALVALMAGLIGWSVIRADSVIRRRILTDPLFISGLFLSVLLVMQWRNVGGVPFVNIFSGQLCYTPPPMEGWPFSLEGQLSRQQLLWFVPPVLFLTVVRHLFSRSRCNRVFRAIVCSDSERCCQSCSSHEISMSR